MRFTYFLWFVLTFISLFSEKEKEGNRNHTNRILQDAVIKQQRAMLVASARSKGFKNLKKRKSRKKSHCCSSESSDSSLSSNTDDFVSKNVQNRKRVGSCKTSPTDSSQELMEPNTHSRINCSVIDLKWKSCSHLCASHLSLCALNYALLPTLFCIELRYACACGALSTCSLRVNSMKNLIKWLSPECL